MTEFKIAGRSVTEGETNQMSWSKSMAWIDEMSPERYRPMMRLLDNRDFEFLRSQPGITSKQIAALRAQRCRIFRDYLRSLNSDFARVSMALKLLLAQSGQDRPDLASLLLRRQAQFAVSMIRVQCRLLLFTCGFGRVDVSALVKLFDGMRLELVTMTPDAA